MVLNIEHFSFGEGLGHTPTAPGPSPDVRNYAWRDFGLRVGVRRILDQFDSLSLPACHLVNSAVYDDAPQIMERVRARDVSLDATRALGVVESRLRGVSEVLGRE